MNSSRDGFVPRPQPTPQLKVARPPQVTPVILCGGTGTRLWPLSRATYPKQYWALAGSGEETLVQQTHQRLEGIAGLEAPLLICNEDHRFIVVEQMRQIGLEPGAILLEPMGRNTAPAVAVVAALQATAHCDDPLLLVLAANHVIRYAVRFRQTVEAGQLLTFGTVPTAPTIGLWLDRSRRAAGWARARRFRSYVLSKSSIILPPWRERIPGSTRKQNK